jgi:hypothetical protein
MLIDIRGVFLVRADNERGDQAVALLDQALLVQSVRNTCVERAKTNGHFGASRTPISDEAERRFRLMPNGDFG